MIIRPATVADVASCDENYNAERQFMRKSGNANHWSGEYPNGDDVIDGIGKGTSYVCEDNGEVVATFHFDLNAVEEDYHEIYEGEWKDDLPYAVIHRIAVKYHGRGIIDFCFNECFKMQSNLRIDTHEDNIPMRKCLSRCGFEYCGVVYLKGVGKRLAYQKMS